MLRFDLHAILPLARVFVLLMLANLKRDPYLTSQLIAYIGNKRSLLPFLHDVFDGIKESCGITSFIDPFAGSGAVARLAKRMGFSVYASDWEPYAYVINMCHVGFDKKDTTGLFRDQGGVEEAYRLLNEGGSAKNPYIAAFYAPQNTHAPDLDTERLFYTAENARFIDWVREQIDEWYPEPESGLSMERMILLSSLIYQSATHVNTSGVYKAYHRGFGGHGKDALRRIMAPMQLQIPLLIDGAGTCRVSDADALEYVHTVSADLCYLDPPYNQHQYGSNYHLLNTITLWDRPEAPLDIGPDGKLKEKAGIRSDWNRTKSPFCYTRTAYGAMQTLLEGIDARFIVISYSTDGIVPFSDLFDLLSGQGRTELRSTRYVTYRGGKQSISRSSGNVEYVLVLDRKHKTDPTAYRKMLQFLTRDRMRNLVKSTVDPRRIREHFPYDGDGIYVDGALLPMNRHYTFSQSETMSWIDSAPAELLDQFEQRLLACRFQSHQVEAHFILDTVLELGSQDRRRQLKRFMWLLRKFTFKKYKDECQEMIQRARNLASTGLGEDDWFIEQLNRIQDLAESRFLT